MTEHILVVRTEELKKHYDFQGFLPLNPEQVLQLYDQLDVFGMDRDKAEPDPTHKQFIAYSAIHCKGKFLTYVRGKDLGEARLHGNRSMGIGGHINSSDNATLFLDDHLKVAAHREVDEEIKINEKYDLELVGLLNDDSNEVGSVHLGLVYVADLASEDVQKRERGIAQIKFETPEEILPKKEEFETWSQILIDNLDKLI